MRTEAYEAGGSFSAIAFPVYTIRGMCRRSIFIAVLCVTYWANASDAPRLDGAADHPPDAVDVGSALSDPAADSRGAAELTRAAARLIRQRDWARAESVLVDALALGAENPLNLYYLACARAQLGRKEQAVEALERAAAAGFSDFLLIGSDPNLSPLRRLPRFEAFFAERENWQRRAGERIIAGLRPQFGNAYAYEIDADRKLVYATNLGAEALAELKDSVEAQARGLGRDLFTHKPWAYVTLVLPSAADYRKIMRFHNVGGAYFDATRMLVAQRTGDVMRHELTHALHAADRAPLGQEHAAWVIEGLGVLYESTEVLFAEDGDIMVPLADNARLPAATAAARRKGLVPLVRLLAMTPGEFLQRPNITYTQSGALMLYLRDRGLLRKFYDTYKRTWDADPTGRAALEEVSGTSLDQFQSTWIAWLLARPAAPFFGAPALFLGARVAPGEGGMTVVSLAPNGPAVDAGIAPRDVILQVNGKPVKDYASLRPALGSYTPGRTVRLRVRRRGDERDVIVTLQNLNSAPRLAPQ